MSSPDGEDRRRAALIGFLGAGLDPAPPTATLVSALADARRTVSVMRFRKEPLREWLAKKARLRGIGENAATLAAMEISDERDVIAEAYRRRYPQRADQLDGIITWLNTQDEEL